MNEEKVWDNISRYYVNFLEKFHFPMAQILYDAFDIHDAENVLEIGTGGGYNLKQFIIQKPKKCHWVATDISEMMLSICEQRIEEFFKNPLLEVKHDYMTEEIPKFYEKNIESLNISFKKVDAHDLKQFESNSFDRYFANHAIGNRPNREIIFQEAQRVLRPNGLLAFTSFGRRENCNTFTFIKDVAIEVGIDPSKFPEKDAFDYADKSIIVPLLEQAGFKIIKHFFVVFPVFNLEEQIEYKELLKIYLGTIEVSEEMIEKIGLAAKKKLREVIGNKSVLTIEAQYFIAIKTTK